MHRLMQRSAQRALGAGVCADISITLNSREGTQIQLQRSGLQSPVIELDPGAAVVAGVTCVKLPYGCGSCSCIICTLALCPHLFFLNNTHNAM